MADTTEDKQAKTYIPTGTGAINEIQLRKKHRQYSLEEQVKGSQPLDYEDWIKNVNG